MNRRNSKTTITLAAVAAALLGAALGSGCGDGGSGTVRITTYGEDFIEQEIPAAGAGGEGFVDGNSVRFSRFLVAFSEISVADSSGARADEIAGPLVFDLKPPGPHLIGELTQIEARRWDRFAVAVQPAAAATAGNATAADVQLMNDNGYSVFVAGEATDGQRTVVFSWGFANTTRYSECHEKSHGEGVVVPSGGTAPVELTIHGDHLFYDDLQSSEPSLRFAAIADADADSDGEVTLEELASVDLTTLPVGQYGTGGLGTVVNLRQFITALTRTLVHFQGEGHCHSGS